MIRFENVSKVFGQGATQVQVLKNLTFTVPQGQFCAVMGPSGSGKSTILHVGGWAHTPHAPVRSTWIDVSPGAR